MFIDNIEINNFRNIKKAKLNLDKNINFIIGNNAQGKTNIIESIFVSAFLKSFRTQKRINLIKDGTDKLNVKSNIIKVGVNNFIDICIDKNNSYIKVNGKKAENFEYLNVVIFHPEEIDYISNYPVFRRNLIDRSIFYVNYSYIDLYRNYLRCLKQRNLSLKNKITDSDIWKEQLIFYGKKIINERIKYIKKINSILDNESFKRINSEKYNILYSKNYTEKNIEQMLSEEFLRKKDREIQLGYTLVGPHKDDIVFYLNGKPADTFASQGQKRSMIISYKTAQILDYKAIQGHYPVLILDDMTSELDANRKNVLLENLLENSGQVFITSTDFRPNNFSENSKVFRVNNGEVSVAD